MHELLRALADHLTFLLGPGRCRLVDSRTGSSFNDAWITMESDRLRWRLVRDRAQIFLECQPVEFEADLWYSTDLLIRHITGERVETAELNAETASWLEENLDEVDDLFGPERRDRTLDEMKQLKARRAKELFG